MRTSRKRNKKNIRRKMEDCLEERESLHVWRRRSERAEKVGKRLKSGGGGECGDTAEVEK